MAHFVGARLVADRAAELLQRRHVTLTGEQEASPAVVPDRAGFFAAVTGFDLGQVVKAEEQWDALPGTAGYVTGETRDAGEVGRLIKRQQQPRLQHTALG